MNQMLKITFHYTEIYHTIWKMNDLTPTDIGTYYYDYYLLKITSCGKQV